MHTRITLGLLATAIALMTAPVFAGDGTGLISAGWNIYDDGNVFFYLTGPHNDPACPAIPGRWAFDTTTPAGKSMFATFLSAYSHPTAVHRFTPFLQATPVGARIVVRPDAPILRPSIATSDGRCLHGRPRRSCWVRFHKPS